LSPIRIIGLVRIPEPDCFLRYRICAGTRNFTSGESHVYVLPRPAAAAMRGVVLKWFYSLSRLKHLCRRYMRSTKCPSSYTVNSASDLSLRTIKCCSVVFGVTLRLLDRNTLSSSSAINKLRRLLLPAISVTNLPRRSGGTVLITAKPVAGSQR